MDSIEQTMYWLLAGSKGSLNRIRILQSLEKKPMNLNELSKVTEMNYKTAQHHVELLLENNLLIAKGNKYGQVYFISDLMKSKKDLFATFIQSIQPIHETKEEPK